MSLLEQDVLAVLRQIPYPGFSRDIVSLGVLRRLSVDGERIRLELDPGPANPAGLEQAVRAALAAFAPAASLEIKMTGAAAGSPALRMAGAVASAAAAGGVDAGLIPEVRHAIAVASGKGGVGKSTVAVNLAVALARSGLDVGLLDADIYGPSIPLMMGVKEAPQLTPDKKLVPFERFGVRFMSLGFLVDPEAALIWRGPMVMKAIEQLLRDVVWGPLDVLVVDLPPGTGDAQLTLSQKVRLAGAVIVTTPQDVALADAVKGVAMFRKVQVPILGIVENMSYFECPSCLARHEIFSRGGGRRQAERLGVPFLGEVPLHPSIRSGGDRGEPAAALGPESPESALFASIAENVRVRLFGEIASESEPRASGWLGRLRKMRGAPQG